MFKGVNNVILQKYLFIFYYTMNGYNKIFLVSVFIIVFSIISEMYFPCVDNSKPSTIEYLHICLIRYIHYLVYLLSSFYLIFFSGIGKKFDAYVYLTLVFGIVFGWYIFDSCWLSYSELLFYDIDLEKTKTTFHPTFTSIFGNYTSSFMTISGLLYIITVSILLLSLKSIHFIYKLLYFIVFLFLFVDALLKSRVGTVFYSAKKNKQLDILKTIYNKYSSSMKNYLK
jgi:hypothetical protein